MLSSSDGVVDLETRLRGVAPGGLDRRGRRIDAVHPETEVSDVLCHQPTAATDVERVAACRVDAGTL